MIEFNVTRDIYQTLLRKLQTQQQLPSAADVDSISASIISDSSDDFDTQPIDLQDFIDTVTNSNRNNDIDGTSSISRYLEYAAAEAATTSASALGMAATKYSGSTTLQPTALLAEQLLNLTLQSLYKNNNSLFHQQFPDDGNTSSGDEDYSNACKDEYDPTSDNTYFEFWVCGILLNILGILGIFGNIISMIILSRPQMRSSINYLLIGLARCDTVLIITSILLFGIPSVYPYTGNFFFYYNYIYPYISPAVYPIAMIAQTASIYMTFTVTLERYVAVCHPLKARALCTYGRAKIYFIVCVIFSLLYNFPRFWEVLAMSNLNYPKSASSRSEVDGDGTGTQIMLHCVRASELRSNPAYINIYIHWCYLVFNYIIPFLTLAILNCLIYRQVKHANQERQRLSRSEKREIGLATMLLCVVIVFFLFNFLALVLNISEAFYDFIDHKLTKISNLLVTINSGANFLIYVIFGERFKRIFLLIFFKRRLSRDQPDLIHYESSISNNGDGTTTKRASGRFSRHGTQRSTTNTYLTPGSGNSTLNSVRLTQTGSPGAVKIKRHRAPSPGPIVYYPARDLQRTSTTAMPVLVSNNNTPLDWTDTKNCQMTSGF